MIETRWWIALIVAAFACMHASAASAGLKLCNRTSYVLYAATAFPAGAETVTKGWTRIVPGTCQVAIKEALIAPVYYVHAHSSLAHSGSSRAWGGKFSFCVKDTNFVTHVALTVAGCPSDDLFALPFAEIDTHHMRAWTMTFSEPPDVASMDDAARKGLKRLLRDNRCHRCQA